MVENTHGKLQHSSYQFNFILTGYYIAFRQRGNKNRLFRNLCHFHINRWFNTVYIVFVLRNSNSLLFCHAPIPKGVSNALTCILTKRKRKRLHLLMQSVWSTIWARNPPVIHTISPFQIVILWFPADFIFHFYGCSQKKMLQLVKLQCVRYKTEASIQNRISVYIFHHSLE